MLSQLDALTLKFRFGTPSSLTLNINHAASNKSHRKLSTAATAEGDCRHTGVIDCMPKSEKCAIPKRKDSARPILVVSYFLQCGRFEMPRADCQHRRFGSMLPSCVLIAATTLIQIAPADASNEVTVTPIKHIIIIIGENHRFYHVFATYRL